MRIGPSFTSAGSPSPAAQFVQRAQWLLGPDSVVTALVPTSATSVRMFVADPFVTDPHDRDEADRLVADSAMTVLEQAAHGVRLIPTTRRFYEGRMRELAPAQLTFLTGLPGVERHDLVPEDVDEDGFVAPEEVAHHVEVGSSEHAARLDWLLRDRLHEGSIFDGPVRIIPPQPA